MAKGNTTSSKKSTKTQTKAKAQTKAKTEETVEQDVLTVDNIPAEPKKPAKATKAAKQDINDIEDYTSSSFDENKSIRILNLTNWNLTFRLSGNGESGDILIPPKGTAFLKRNEIQSQVRNNNTLFVGVDGRGSHAEIYIDDIATRCWLGFETPNKPQLIFTKQIVSDLFDLPNDEFEEMLSKYIVTRAEKVAFKDAIEELKINDYSKIRFAAQHLGFKMF